LKKISTGELHVWSLDGNWNQFDANGTPLTSQTQNAAGDTAPAVTSLHRCPELPGDRKSVV